MAQKRLNIFLASSSELSDERVIIGNRIRLLNDEWEPQGVRIRLEIWEDFEPEFTGTRKQTEYNEKLIDESQIVIGLFRTKCGKYTQEEVLRAHNNKAIDLHCFVLSSVCNNTLSHFFKSENIAYSTIVDIELLWEVISKIIEDYITFHYKEVKKKSINNPIPKQNPNQERVYATVASDMQCFVEPLGDVFRRLDDLGEDIFNLRLSLTMNEKEKVICSNYYMAILNNEVDDNSEEEFVKAYEGQYRKNQPQYISVFQYYEGKATKYDAGNTISNIMAKTNKEFFAETFKDLNAVRLSLLVHLIRRKGVINPIIAVKRGKDDSLFVDGSSIVNHVGKTLGLETIVVDDFQVQINLLDLMMPDKMRLGLESKYRNEICEIIKGKSLSDIDVRRLFKVSSDLVVFLIKNNNCYETDYVLRVMLLRIMVIEKYYTLLKVNPCPYYKEFIDYADRHSYVDVTVEGMRINYANCLTVEGKESEAAVVYGTARKNMFQLDMNNRMSRTATLCLYYNSLASLSTSHQNAEMTEWLSELSKIIDSWIKEDDSNYYYQAYVYAFDIDRVEVNVYADKTILSDAERLWHIMNNDYSSSSSYSFISAFHILTRSLSRYYVDRVSMRGTDQDTRNAELATYYFKVEEELNNVIVLYDVDEGMNNLAVMYHNKGFLYSKMNDYQNALVSYENALRIRRAIYNRDNNALNLDSIAETLVNTGALIFLRSKEKTPINDVEQSLQYAEESIDIYKQNNNGSLNAETNYYKALLLKGTILFYFGLKNEERKKGFDIINEIKKWDSEKPSNYYHSVIQNELDRVEVLLRSGMII